MTIEKLVELITGDFNKAKEKIEGNKDYSVIEKYLEQFDPKKHDIFSIAKRPWKIIQLPKYDQQGNQIGTEEKSVDVTRISVPFQQMIVSRAISFLLGNPIKIDANPTETQKSLYDAFTKTWEDNKLVYESKEIARLMFSETECAELWYTEDAKNGYWDGTGFTSIRKLRMRKLAYSFGDKLYPVFDMYGDMIAFGRGYLTINDEGTKMHHFDIYTDDFYYLSSQYEGKEWITTIEKNFIGKIPVIYYAQPYPEWHSVQEMCDRYETLISNHADTNDYNGSPIILVMGQIKNFSAKGERGKVLQLEEGADAKYMSWDSAPESIKLEAETLWMLIHTNTDTPDLTPNDEKGYGDASGVALQMRFLNAHLKAAAKEEIVGKAFQRRMNYIRYALSFLGKQKTASSLVIKPVLEYYLPKNEVEKINTLVTAKTGGIMSQETAVKQNPLIEDADAEVELVKAEKEAAQKEAGLDGIMND